MEFRRVNSSDADLYDNAMELYKASFPIYEQRERDSQISVMGNEAYHFNLIYDGGVWVGLMLYWETAAFIYVEHFCILPHMRNRQYGRRALGLLNEAGKAVILEIDPPVGEVSIRRKSFYERAGFQANPFTHVHPPYRSGFAGHRLVVMSCPTLLSESAYDMFYRYLSEVVMKPEREQGIGTFKGRTP